MRRDPRWAVLATFGYILAIELTPLGRWHWLAVEGLVLAFVIGLAGLNPEMLVKRWLGLLMLVGFLGLLVASGHPRRAELGLGAVAAAILAKNGAGHRRGLDAGRDDAVSPGLAGVSRLGMPAVLVATLHFLYRYMHVLADEVDAHGASPPGAHVPALGTARLGSIGGPDRHVVRPVAGARRTGPRGDAGQRLGRHLAHTRRGRHAMNADPPAAVRVCDLAYRYPDGREALRGVSFTIAPGETVALVGPNGAGKSTLLWHLNGLLPGKAAQPLHGHAHGLSLGGGRVPPSVWIDGLEVNDRNAPEVRRRVGLLFQDPDDQLFSTSVLDDVAFGPLNLGRTKAEAKAIARECLARVELIAAADRMPHHLSFGERKRVCLAGVLACAPSVLVLDEPTANLDPRGRRRFLELLQGLDATKLIATHDLEMALKLCTRALVLDAGRIVADGPAAALLADAALMDAHGLEVPMSLRLGRVVNL